MRKTFVISLGITFLFVILTISVPIVSSQADAKIRPIIIYPTDDALIKQPRPDANYGDFQRLYVRNEFGATPYPNADGWQWSSLIKFDLRSLQSSTDSVNQYRPQILSANLFLYYNNTWDANPAGREISLHLVREFWHEHEVTWNTRPSIDQRISSISIVPSRPGVWMSWDVTKDVQAFIDGAISNHGWRLTDDNYWGNFDIPIVDFRSKESDKPELIPYLLIEYISTDSVEPPKPPVFEDPKEVPDLAPNVFTKEDSDLIPDITPEIESEETEEEKIPEIEIKEESIPDKSVELEWIESVPPIIPPILLEESEEVGDHFNVYLSSIFRWIMGLFGFQFD